MTARVISMILSPDVNMYVDNPLITYGIVLCRSGHVNDRFGKMILYRACQ